MILHCHRLAPGGVFGVPGVLGVSDAMAYVEGIAWRSGPRTAHRSHPYSGPPRPPSYPPPLSCFQRGVAVGSTPTWPGARRWLDRQEAVLRPVGLGANAVRSAAQAPQALQICCYACGRPWSGPGSFYNSDVERIPPLPLPCRICNKTMNFRMELRHNYVLEIRQRVWPDAWTESR